MLAGQPNPYTEGELSAIAAHCTERQDAARKVEREMSKRLAAVAMQNRIGDLFNAIVTGVTPHGTFVRVLQPRVEGLLVKASSKTDVGDQLRVRLIRTDVQHGYIDFAAQQ
jgi:exoribonuclease-2